MHDIALIAASLSSDADIPEIIVGENSNSVQQHPQVQDLVDMQVLDHESHDGLFDLNVVPTPPVT